MFTCEPNFKTLVVFLFPVPFTNHLWWGEGAVLISLIGQRVLGQLL